MWLNSKSQTVRKPGRETEQVEASTVHHSVASQVHGAGYAATRFPSKADATTVAMAGMATPAVSLSHEGLG